MAPLLPAVRRSLAKAQPSARAPGCSAQGSLTPRRGGSAFLRAGLAIALSAGTLTLVGLGGAPGCGDGGGAVDHGSSPGDGGADDRLDRGGDGAGHDATGDASSDASAGPAFVGTALIEKLHTDMPSVTFNFYKKSDAPNLTYTDRSGCKIACNGMYPDDPGITCAPLSLTPPSKLDDGSIRLDVDDMTYTYDFVGNAYMSAMGPKAPFFATGARLRVTTSGVSPPQDGVPDALQGEVTGPAPVNLSMPMTGDSLGDTLPVAWAPGTGGTKAVIALSVQFQALDMGMPTATIVRSMNVTCEVDDTGDFVVPADVVSVLRPGMMDTYFQCAGPNHDQCVTLTVKRQNSVDASGGSTQFTVIGSTSSPLTYLTVPVMAPPMMP